MTNLKIVFVDDESNILFALKRKLHVMRNEWDMSFFDSAKKAIEFMHQDEPDFLVTDMRMPEINGLDLLRYSYKHFPRMVRIILSGQTEKNQILQSIGLAHQFFSKPTDTSQLIDLIKGIAFIRSVLHNSEMINQITRIKSLPTLPSIYMQLRELLNSDDSSIKDIASLISQDISLSARILQLVNSSFFSIMKKISDIQQAISLLGLEIVKDLILSLHLFENVKPDLLKNYHLNELWNHSTAVAIIAKHIANDFGFSKEKIENCFIAGLLHDIGRLILVNEKPFDYVKVIEKVQEEHLSVSDAENELFKINHSEIAAYLISIWGFSHIVVLSVFLHHNPALFDDRTISPALCVHLANYVHHKLDGSHLQNHFVNIDEPCYDESLIAELNLTEKINQYISYFNENPIVINQFY